MMTELLVIDAIFDSQLHVISMVVNLMLVRLRGADGGRCIGK